jgi:hypothetical protein
MNTSEMSLKIKKQFIKNNIQFLNNFLSSNLLKTKENVLKLKNRLVNELELELNNILKAQINQNYSKYIRYLFGVIKGIHTAIDKPPEIVIEFNSKDYNYFIKNLEKINQFFINPVKIYNNLEDHINGFKVILFEGTISFDYTINNLLTQSITLIEHEFSKVLSDSIIKELERDFENFIQNQKLRIEEYLYKYEQV